jgi:hypothetical protein
MVDLPATTAELEVYMIYLKRRKCKFGL